MCAAILLYRESERVSFFSRTLVGKCKGRKYMLCIHKQDLPFFNLTFASLSWHHVNKISIVD